MRLCAVVVTYYPDVKDATENILRYLPYVDHLIIWENTPRQDVSSYKITLPAYNDKINYMGTGKNEGIPVALNSAVDWAKENGYTHLLTMDQDSKWEDFQNYRKYIADNGNSRTIYAPNVNRLPQSEEGTYITSGMIVPLEVYDVAGKYCRSFKIDVVDHEFCFRLKSKDISFCRVEAGNIEQTFGVPVQKKFFWKKIKYAKYDAERLGEIVRNYLALIRKYDVSKKFIKRVIKVWIIQRYCMIIWFEDKKWDKLKALTSGIFKGLFCRNIIRI